MEITKIEQIKDISSLARALRKSDLPEEIIRKLSAQSLFMLIKHETLESAPELVEAASVEQIRLLLDFDLWEADELQEDRIWQWLEISSEEDELVILQKVANSIDLKIVAYLINQHVDIQQNEEPSDAAPGPLFFSPDKGFTWIRVNAEDQRVHFLISKLLAYLFESSSDIFYQLLATKTVVTPSLLIEEALKDRSKRLSAEGFPDKELAQEVCAFLSLAEALQTISTQKEFRCASEALFSEPLVRLTDALQPLSSVLAEIKDLESALSEMCLIINSGFLRFNIPIADIEQSAFLSSQVQGAINIGLELLSVKGQVGALDIVKRVGFQIPFRVGLTQILEISKQAKKYRTRLLEENQTMDPATTLLLEFITRPFPCIPTELSQIKDDFELDGDKNSLDSRPSPFRFWKEVELLKKKLLNSF